MEVFKYLGKTIGLIGKCGTVLQVLEVVDQDEACASC